MLNKLFLVTFFSLLLPLQVAAFSLNSVQKVTDSINSNMHYLSLDEFHDISRFPDKLSEFTSLEIISANGNNISDISVLQQMKNLRFLSMNYTEIADISALANLDKLERLDLKGTKVSDIGALSELQSLLLSLSLYATKVKDLTSLANLTQLQSLNLGYTKVTDISVLKSLKNLRSLNILWMPLSDFSATGAFRC